MAKVKEVKTETLKGKKQKCVELTDGTKVFQPDGDIEELMYTAFAEKFSNGKTNQKSWIAQFVDQQMDSLKTNLKKDPLIALSAMREVTKAVNNTQNYFNTKKQTDSDFSKYLLRDTLFYYQQDVYDEKLKKKFALCWGRRSGKSTLNSRLAFKHCLEEDPQKKKREVIIIGLTLERTKDLYWEELKQCAKLAHIPITVDNSSYKITLSNGNNIQLWGNNSKTERAKLRGRDSSMFIIDEMQSQQGLHELLEQVIGPIIKGRDGVLVCVGTGPLSGGTEWERILNDENWFHSDANMTMNPTIANHEDALKNVLEENGWTEDNVVFQREYLGRCVYDTNLMIWPKVEYYSELPKDFHPTKAIVGIDLGFADKSAIIPLLFDDFGQGYILEGFSGSRMDSEELFQKCIETKELLKNVYHIPVEDMKFVTDTNEQNMTQTWYNRGLYELTNAVKHPLNYSIANINSGLASGKIKILEDSPVDIDHKCTVYKFDNEKNSIVYEEDKSTYHADAMHAARYAYDYYIDSMAAS